MTAFPPDDARCSGETALATRQVPGSLMSRWETIGHATGRLAAIAGLSRSDTCIATANFLPLFEQAAGWQRARGSEAIEDLTAMLNAGMAALDVLEGRGIDARIPALALWREVDAAQRSLIAMLAADTRV